MKPLVPILIPAYNAEEWIAESIQSATEISFGGVAGSMFDTENRKNGRSLSSGRPEIHPNN